MPITASAPFSAPKSHEVVNYFTHGRLVPGSDSDAVECGGVTWPHVFASHRDLFKLDHEKCAPQFRSVCTWGVVNGQLFDLDPMSVEDSRWEAGPRGQRYCGRTRAQTGLFAARVFAVMAFPMVAARSSGGHKLSQ